MKRVILFSLGLFWISTKVFGQQHSYRSIFESQAQWDLKVLDYGSGKIAPLSQYVQKDTLISGQGFMVLQENANTNAQKGVFIREDETRGKVYVIENGQNYLLYDFTLEKGDKFSFKDFDFEVIAVKELKLLDSKRKMIELRCISRLADNMVWIEGVGSTISPLYYKDYANSLRSVKVACFFKGQHLEYSLSDQPCAKQLLAKDNFESIFNLSISPNPFEDQIRLSFNDLIEEKVTIKLYNVAGQELYQEEMFNPANSFEKKIDFPNLKEGLYFLNVSTARYITTRKIVKY